MQMCAWSDLCSGVELHAGRGQLRNGLRCAAGACREITQQVCELLFEAGADSSGDAHHHALGRVPAVEVREERLAGCVLHRFLAAEDVPAESVVAVHEVVEHAGDEVPRRIEVHVHLLDDHALLTVDLLGVEAGVTQQVDEHVERDVAALARAAHVVAGDLLAGEGVELAADGVDLGRDVARRRAPPVPLKNMCSAKCAMPFDSRVSYRAPAASMTKHETDWACSIGAVSTRSPLGRTCRS